MNPNSNTSSSSTIYDLALTDTVVVAPRKRITRSTATATNTITSNITATSTTTTIKPLFKCYYRVIDETGLFASQIYSLYSTSFAVRAGKHYSDNILQCPAQFYYYNKLLTNTDTAESLNITESTKQHPINILASTNSLADNTLVTNKEICPSLNLLQFECVDASFKQQFVDFVNHFNGKRRQYHRIKGDLIEIELSDTDRMDPLDEDDEVKVVDIVKIIVTDESKRNQGIFKSCLEFMLQVMRTVDHWRYLRVESIRSKYLINHLKARQDVVWKEWDSTNVWIGMKLDKPSLFTTNTDLLSSLQNACFRINQ